MWCAVATAPAAVEATARRTDAIAWSPTPILIPKWLIEAYVIPHFSSAIVAAACHATGGCRKHDYYQSAH
jgi:hypothetical protein